jgi:uncharacterized protein (UPF0210 family)
VVGIGASLKFAFRILAEGRNIGKECERNFNVVFGTSDVVLCCVDVDFDVASVTWILCLG